MHSAWTSNARPSVAATLTLKQCSRVYKNTPFSFKKLNNFLGRGHSLSPDPKFRRPTFGPLSKILNTPLLLWIKWINLTPPKMGYLLIVTLLSHPRFLIGSLVFSPDANRLAKLVVVLFPLHGLLRVVYFKDLVLDLRCGYHGKWSTSLHCHMPMRMTLIY